MLMADAPSFAAMVAALGLTVPVTYKPDVVSHYSPADARVVIDSRIGRQPGKGSVGWYVLAHELFHNAQKQRGDTSFDEEEADRFGKWWAPLLERQALQKHR